MRHFIKPQVWAGGVWIATTVLTVVAIFAARPLSAIVCGIVAGSFWTVTRVLNHRDPIPMPYYIRWLMFLPRGPHSPRHLCAILAPQPGERMLEVGAGPGVHAVAIGQALRPNGVLDVLDMQPQMLDHLRRRCRQTGITNVVTSLGNAQALPYADHVFDAAYLVAVLGEIPNEAVAMRELRRVLKPEGRLVIGEVVVDPDYVSPHRLIEIAKEAGFVFQERRGPRASYFALFRPI